MPAVKFFARDVRHYLNYEDDKMCSHGIITAFFTAILVVVGASAHAQPVANVVTTIGQITDAASYIGRDHMKVTGLMGPGVDPHLYKASESDVRKLAEADLILYNGLYLEAKMEPVFEKMQRYTKTFALGKVLDSTMLLESVNYSGHYDPHIWFDIPLWKKIVERIRDIFVEHDPARQSDYIERAAEYLRKMDELHAYVQKRVDEVPAEQRVLVTAHDAFRYFGRRYGVEVIGLQGISTESEAGAKDVIELADFITERKIRAIFIESSVPERNIRAVQEAVRARGWEVEIGGELFSDAMGSSGTFEGTYFGMITHNIDTIVDSLLGDNHDE